MEKRLLLAGFSLTPLKKHKFAIWQCLIIIKGWGLEVKEIRITIDEVLNGLKEGTVTEVFGAGTAAVITPVGILSYKGEDYLIGSGETGPVATRFYEHLTGIQYGKEKDPFGWVEAI